MSKKSIQQSIASKNVDSALLPCRDESSKKTQIRKAAYQVMNKLGFDAASYSEIAKHSGYGRPLVQMYFPKKDQFILDMNEEIIDSITLLLSDSGKLDGNSYEKTLRVAQAYFALSLRDENAIRLTRESLGHRSMMKSVFDLYQMKVITIGFEADPSAINVATLKALGGVEELIMDEIDRERLLDSNDIACQLLAGMQVFLDEKTYRQAYSEMREYLLPRAEIDEIVDTVAKEVLFLSDDIDQEEQEDEQQLVRSIA